MNLSANSSFNGWASITSFEQKLFIPHLDDEFDPLESIKPNSESCSLVYRGKLYVYGLGLAVFLLCIFNLFPYER